MLGLLAASVAARLISILWLEGLTDPLLFYLLCPPPRLPGTKADRIRTDTIYTDTNNFFFLGLNSQIEFKHR
jgi:hypothetical protein